MKSSQTPITENKYGEQLSFDPQFHGPVKSRSCTDILCLFLFISFIAGWCVVGFFAFREGDPKVLLYPTDSAGNICGVGKFESKPYLFFFDLMKCARPDVLISGCLTPQVCVEQCPNTTFYASTQSSNHEEVKKKMICKYDVDKSKKDLKTLIDEGNCARLYFKSRSLMTTNLVKDIPYASRIKDVLFGRCIPTLFDKNMTSGVVKDEKNQTVKQGDDELTIEAVKNATEHLAKFLSVGEFGEKIFSDFKTSWKYLLTGLLLSMVVSLIWIILMRWVAGPMVWLSIILLLAFSAFACYYSSTRYVALKDLDTPEVKFRLTLKLDNYLAMRKTWLGFAISSGVIFAILFLVILFLRKRIYIAIALIKEASRAVGCMPSALLFPLLPYVLMLIFFICWTAVALYIASSGKASFVLADVPAGSDLKNGSMCNPHKYNNITGEGIKCLFRTYGLKDNILTSHIYNLFGLFWGLFFSVGVGQVALAGAFASYFWTQDKSKDIPTFAVATGLYRCVRFHLGSICFGSLLIATCRMIRVMLEYIDKQCKKYDNSFTKAILCIMKCCFWCLENLLKFISKNAYIMIAIYGKNFCTSARKAFMLLMRNILRVVVLDKLTDFLLFLGKLVVVTLTAGTSFYFFATDQELYKGIPALNYNLLPPIVITIGAYLIASGFFSVYGMAVDTLFLCFLEDCERNDGSPEKPYFMSKELMKILHKKNRFREVSPPSSPSRP